MAQQVEVKKKGIPKWLIIVGIIVVIGIIAAATAKPKAATTDVGTTGATPAPTSVQAIVDTPVPPTAVPPTVAPSNPKIGDKVTVGSWELVVEKVETSTGFDWSGFKNMQTPKGKYLLVYVNATNTSAKSATINSFDYKITDSTGAEFDTCPELGCSAYPKQVDRESFFTQVPPRLSTKLLAIFDLPPDSKGLVLSIERDTKIELGDL